MKQSNCFCLSVSPSVQEISSELERLVSLVAKIDFGGIDFARIGFGTIAWVDSFGFSMIDLGKIVGFGYFGIISFCIVGIRAPI